METVIDLLVVVGFSCLAIAVALWLERAVAAAAWRSEWRRKWHAGGAAAESVDA